MTEVHTSVVITLMAALGPNRSAKVSLKVDRRRVIGAGGPVGRSFCFMVFLMYKDIAMDSSLWFFAFFFFWQINFLKACMLQKALNRGKQKLYLQYLTLIFREWEDLQTTSLTSAVSVSTTDLKAVLKHWGA